MKIPLGEGYFNANPYAVFVSAGSSNKLLGERTEKQVVRLGYSLYMLTQV